jgi:O-antigen/teichoic acid export membrane protein
MPSPLLRKVLHGSATNTLRVLLSMLVSLVLPSFLVHRMPTAEYSAWVLILQISAYVNFLDFGLSTAIGKYVAEYDATGNREAGRKLVSTALTVLTMAALLALLALGGVLFYLPQLFRQMPLTLLGPMRAGLVAVGLSTCFALPFSVFTSVFSGLQEYTFPTVLFTISRVGSAAALILLVLRHGTLLELACVLALFNLVTAWFQYFGWKRFVSHRVDISFFLFDRAVATGLIEYCGILSIWTVGTILISGLDTTIVGHFDYAHTGFYAVASSATNFMLLLVGNVFGPLMPALSSTQASRTPAQMGDLLIRASRYGTLLLCVLGLPLFVGGYPLLRAWVGPLYARNSLLFLEVLVIGNVIRQLGAPYALMVVATGRQRLATLSPVAEALVNFTFSILLARRSGAIGVALGTVIGAVLGLAVHFLVSMRLTRPVIDFPETRLLVQGMLRPLACALPTLLLLPFWRRFALIPFSPALLAAWALASVLLAWAVGLDPRDRHRTRAALARLLY